MCYYFACFSVISSVSLTCFCFPVIWRDFSLITVYEEIRKVTGRLRFKQPCDSLQLLLLLPVAWIWSLRLGQLSAAPIFPEIRMWRESVMLKVKCGYNINRSVDSEYRLKICHHR